LTTLRIFFINKKRCTVDFLGERLLTPSGQFREKAPAGDWLRITKEMIKFVALNESSSLAR
jgi:hypothetical protein